MSTRRQRAALVGTLLDQYFPDPPIPLHHTDPFTLLVAVLLSAQCTDRRVNQVTPTLFKQADTPVKMAALPLEHIEALIQTCGLYRTKARALKATAERLVRDFNGIVPNSFAALESLPGVGHKTASVVMAHAFGIPAFPVDTHIHRLARRWRLSPAKNVRQTEADLKKLFPPKTWERRHLQMIFYGRTHCTARGCDGTRCAICQACRQVGLHGRKESRHARAD